MSSASSSPSIGELEQSATLRFDPTAPGTSLEALYALRRNLKAARVQCLALRDAAAAIPHANHPPPVAATDAASQLPSSGAAAAVSFDESERASAVIGVSQMAFAFFFECDFRALCTFSFQILRLGTNFLRVCPMPL
jgi:hypothetical protein